MLRRRNPQWSKLAHQVQGWNLKKNGKSDATKKPNAQRKSNKFQGNTDTLREKENIANHI